MAADDTPTGTELAMLRGEVMTSLAQIQGDVRLVLQEQQNAARRYDELQRDVRRLDDRVDGLDRTTITREDMDKAVGQVRDEARQRQEQQAEQARRSLMIWALVISAIAAAISGGGIILN